MPFANCEECGAKCCKFFGIPLDVYGDPELDPDPERYFNLHENIKVMETRKGKYIIVYTRCKELGPDYKCRIYDNRPDMCRNFTEENAHKYLVPRGCIYDHDDRYGEDYGV